MKENTCFALSKNNNTCTALNVEECTYPDCTFFKTQLQLNAELDSTKIRLDTISLV